MFIFITALVLLVFYRLVFSKLEYEGTDDNISRMKLLLTYPAMCFWAFGITGVLKLIVIVFLGLSTGHWSTSF